ncbi:hypothetical protein CR513_31862, partial [Mucuna pruriens]
MDFELVQVGKPGRSEEIAIAHEENKGGTDTSKPLIIHFTHPTNASKPLIIHILTLFPYKNSKAIPWRYDVEKKGKAIEREEKVKEEFHKEEAVEFLKFTY